MGFANILSTWWRGQADTVTDYTDARLQQGLVRAELDNSDPIQAIQNAVMMVCADSVQVQSNCRW